MDKMGGLFSLTLSIDMTSRKDRSDKTARALFLEHAAAYFDDLKVSAENAPYGQIFDHVEAFAVTHGRELIRQSMETLLQEQIDDHQKKKKRHSAQSARLKNGIAAIDGKSE